MKLFYSKMKSPVGELYLVSDTKYLKAIIFKKNWNAYKKNYNLLKDDKVTVIYEAKKQLVEYFKGRRKVFKLKCMPEGTDFQLKVWNALRKISYGRTKSYKDQAKLIENEKAARAIGRADGQNPICIIYPCHRVIGSNGSLTGFAGGLKAKKYLLNLEGVRI